MNNSRRPDQLKRRFHEKNVIKNGSISCGRCGKNLSHVEEKDNSTQKCDTSQAINVGDYVINFLNSTGFKKSFQSYTAYNNVTKEEKVAKIFNTSDYNRTIAPFSATGEHENINNVEQIFLKKSKSYMLFKKHHGDLHAYMKKCQRLEEADAKHLFQQIVESVRHCHQNNVVVQEIKLKKFVFGDKNNQRIMLDSLEESVVLKDGQPDWFRERHGCLAYISPEILNSPNGYSGKAADCWSLGVLLYIMLTGKYPFFDTNSTNLFKKICKGAFFLPSFLSPQASCLILNLMRINPNDRMTAEEIFNHPWLSDDAPPAKKFHFDGDQAVPNSDRTHYQEDHHGSTFHLSKPV